MSNLFTKKEKYMLIKNHARFPPKYFEKNIWWYARKMIYSVIAVFNQEKPWVISICTEKRSKGQFKNTTNIPESMLIRCYMIGIKFYAPFRRRKDAKKIIWSKLVKTSEILYYKSRIKVTDPAHFIWVSR